MRFIPLFVFSFLLVLTISCKKDEPGTEANSYASTMQIEGADATITDFSPTTFQELDVDGDGWADFVFEISALPGGLLSVVSSIVMKSVHPGAKMLCHVPSDTLYTGTVVEIYGTPPNVNHTTYGYSGPDNPPGTTMHSVSTLEVADYKSANDVFSTSGSFTVEPVFLNRHHVMQTYDITSVSGDTTYRVGFYHEILGDYYGNEPFRYVCFKISEGNGIERLGWLKIKITNQYNLEILQMGLQNPI